MPPFRNGAVSVHRNQLQRPSEIAAREKSVRRYQPRRSEKSAGRVQRALQDHHQVRSRGSPGEIIQFNNAHTSRLSPPHSLREKYAADHARDEIRRGGEIAARARRRVCCAAAPRKRFWSWFSPVIAACAAPTIPTCCATLWISSASIMRRNWN